jgi:CDP-diacylglycerol--glycerol-3-phosphate 3-phosphatidyltransferase
MQGTHNLIKVIIPNFITFFRILVLPFIILLLLKGGYWNIVLAFVLFLVGSVTDAFDGIVARKLGSTSKFGFVLDPIADKILVLGTLITLSFLEYLNIPLWAVIIIFLRDLMVTILKPISDKLGFSIPTTFFAKTKTTIQFIGISVIFLYMIFVSSKVNSNFSFKFLNETFGLVAYLPFLVILLVTFITIASGVDYIILFIKGLKNKELK